MSFFSHGLFSVLTGASHWACETRCISSGSLLALNMVRLRIIVLGAFPRPSIFGGGSGEAGSACDGGLKEI